MIKSLSFRCIVAVFASSVIFSSPALAAKDPQQIATKAIAQMQKKFDKGVAKGGKVFDKLERKVTKMVNKPVFRRDPYLAIANKSSTKLVNIRKKTVVKMDKIAEKAIRKIQKVGGDQSLVTQIQQELQSLKDQGGDLVDDTINEIFVSIDDVFDFLGI